jgi:hypothetical protein
MDPTTGLPYGWHERTNAVSERDMQLGAVAKASFSARGAYGADGDGDETYRTSEQVEQYWMARIEAERAQASTADANATESAPRTPVPIDWDARAKRRAAEAERYGASARAGTDASVATAARAGISSELALLRVATNACESLAAVLDQRLVALPEEDRAAFAAAVKRSLDRVVKCR